MIMLLFDWTGPTGNVNQITTWLVMALLQAYLINQDACMIMLAVELAFVACIFLWTNNLRISTFV